MKSRDRILAVAYELATQCPVDKITFTDVAKAAGVHWTAVRRCFGSKQEMRRVLAKKQAENNQSLGDTRTRILDAAARVFAEYGYSGATLDQVAAEAGMTKGAVYWHFSSKSDLFLALCERSLPQQLQQLPTQAQYVFSSGDPVQALAELLYSRLECSEEGKGNPMLFFEFVTSSRDPAVKQKLRDTFAKIIDGIVPVIKGWQEAGYMTCDVDPQMLAVMFQSLLHGMLLAWLIDPERVRLDSLVSEVAHVMWKGLHPKNA